MTRLSRCRVICDLAPPPPPFELTDREGGREEGVGEEPDHTTARKPGPLLIIQYSLLWAQSQ